MATPSHDATRIDPLVPCALAAPPPLPLPFVSRTCRCGRPLDSFGHRAAAEQRFWADGCLQLRALAHEFAVREAPAFPVTCMCVIWTFWHQRCTMGAAWKLLRKASRCSAAQSLQWTRPWFLLIIVTARARAAKVDGIALQAARRRKERTYRELVGPRSRAKLVVLAGEVGGRWSAETSTFLRLLAATRARSETPVLRKRAEQAGSPGTEVEWWW